MSWDQLAAMHQENREVREREANTPPLACPNDGTLLDEGPGGTLHCVFDGWTWDGVSGRIRS